MTPEQAFKVGFLFRCAAEGLSKEQTHQRIKQATHDIQSKVLTKVAALPLLIGGLGALAGGTMALGAQTLKLVPSVAGPAAAVALTAPVLAGAATGYTAAQLTNSDSKDALEEAKQDELTSEYERLADEARRRAAMKRIQERTGRRIIPLSASL